MSRNAYDLRSNSLLYFADVVTMQISINTQDETAKPPVPQAPLPPPVPRDDFVKKYVAYMKQRQRQRSAAKSYVRR